MSRSRSRSADRSANKRRDEPKKQRRSKFDMPKVANDDHNQKKQQSPQEADYKSKSQTMFLLGCQNSKAKEVIASFKSQMGISPSKSTPTQSTTSTLFSSGALSIGGAFDLHARRLYVGGIPSNIPDKATIDFLVQTLDKAGGILEAGSPVIKSLNNPEKRYIFLELRSIEETSALIQLDGIRFNDATLRIRRPEDYDKFPEIKTQRPVPKLDTASLGVISTKVEEGPCKVFVGGLPKEFTEDQIKNLLLRYGQLKSFHLVKDNSDNTSRGFAFCEYIDEVGVQNALKSLNGSKIGKKNINVRKTGQNSYMTQQNSLSQEDKAQFEAKLDDFIYYTHKLINEVGVQKEQPSPVDELEKHNEKVASYIQQYFQYPYLSTIVELRMPALTPDVLDNEKEYQEIINDITDELKKFGKIKSIIVPRTADLQATSTVKQSAIGKAYIEYEEVASAFACYNLLYDKPFMGQPVKIDFFNKDMFVTKSLY